MSLSDSNTQSIHKTMLIISGPSGVGKSTLTRALLDRRRSAILSVSHTTRAPRPNEADGVDYHFVDNDTFDSMVQSGEFAEYAQVHGQRYGTSFVEIHKAWDEDAAIVFDIDHQGAEQLRQHFPNAISVLTLPPSLEVLRERLESRGTEQKDVIEQRLSVAKFELSFWPQYDYVLKNDDLESTIENLLKIYDTANLRTFVNEPWLVKEFPCQDKH